HPVDEVSSTIAYDHSRYSKSWKDDRSEHLGHDPCIIGWTSNCFNPFRNIVHSHQYVFILVRDWERSHEVDPPAVEHLYFQDVVLRHFIPLTDISYSLACVAS